MVTTPNVPTHIRALSTIFYTVRRGKGSRQDLAAAQVALVLVTDGNEFAGEHATRIHPSPENGPLLQRFPQVVLLTLRENVQTTGLAKERYVPALPEAACLARLHPGRLGRRLCALFALLGRRRRRRDGLACVVRRSRPSRSAGSRRGSAQRVGGARKHPGMPRAAGRAGGSRFT